MKRRAHDRSVDPEDLRQPGDGGTPRVRDLAPHQLAQPGRAQLRLVRELLERPAALVEEGSYEILQAHGMEEVAQSGEKNNLGHLTPLRKVAISRGSERNADPRSSAKTSSSQQAGNQSRKPAMSTLPLHVVEITPAMLARLAETYPRTPVESAPIVHWHGCACWLDGPEFSRVAIDCPEEFAEFFGLPVTHSRAYELASDALGLCEREMELAIDKAMARWERKCEVSL